MHTFWKEPHFAGFQVLAKIPAIMEITVELNYLNLVAF